MADLNFEPLLTDCLGQFWSKRPTVPTVAVWTGPQREGMLSMWTQVKVSTWRDDGHIRASGHS
jgi:hypothetical protein